MEILNLRQSRFGIRSLQIPYISGVLVNNARDADAYYNRGLAYYNQGNYEQAISDYNQAIEINPQSAEAYK